MIVSFIGFRNDRNDELMNCLFNGFSVMCNLDYSQQ